MYTLLPFKAFNLFVGFFRDCLVNVGNHVNYLFDIFL